MAEEEPGKSPSLQQIKLKMLKPLHFGKHQITSFDILHAFREIEQEETGRLIGLVAHFVYWVVFGHLNDSPLNQFHLKQLFISILQSVTQLEMRQEKKRIFACFVMPLFLLAIRLEVESIYRNTYPEVMSDPETEEKAMQLMSCLVTEIIDPNLYYSRFSFLESGKEAIDLKHQIHKQQSLKSEASPFLPSVKNKFYTRSTLVKNLFPMPSEGKVRARFLDQASTKLPVMRSNTLGSVERTPAKRLTTDPQPSPFKAWTSESTLQSMTDPRHEAEGRMLDMINKVQMLQIAGDKANSSLL